MIPDTPTMNVPLKTDEHGAIRIGKTLVLLELVIHAYYVGETPEGIVDCYPSLKTADVYAVIGYYLANREEMAKQVKDNASYHHSKTVLSALSLFEEHLLVIWMPKYSPFLNPIERFWLQFKQLAVANRLHRSLEDLDQSVTQMMVDQNTFNLPNRMRFLDKFRLVASRLPISHGCA